MWLRALSWQQQAHSLAAIRSVIADERALNQHLAAVINCDLQASRGATERGALTFAQVPAYPVDELVAGSGQGRAEDPALLHFCTPPPG
jgi:hypothetical protein